MKGTFKSILICAAVFALTVTNTKAFSQSLTGTWEGQMADGIFFQLNIIQNGDKLCGYSYDFVRSNPDSYCKEYFNASYNKKTKKWEIISTSFIENAPNCVCKHLPMHLELVYSARRGKQTFKGTLANRNAFGSIFGFLSKDGVYLEKKSDQPSAVLPGMKGCFELMEEKEKNSLVKNKKIRTEKDMFTESAVKSLLRTRMPSLKKEDEDNDKEKRNKVRKNRVKNENEMNDDNNNEVEKNKSLSNNDDDVAVENLKKEMKKRDQEVVKSFGLNSKTATIMVYDNGIIDQDTVSIFDNGKLLLSHRLLSAHPITMEIDLSDTQNHEITLFAENLGNISPNTAYVLIIAGEQRFELRASADLTKNASLILKYTP